MLLISLYLHLAMTAGIQAVNITMKYSLAQWDPGNPRISTPHALHLLLPFNVEAQCNNIPPAVCCNDLLAFRRVKFTGLITGDLASTWFRRDWWNYELERIASNQPLGSAGLGCGGHNQMITTPNDQGEVYHYDSVATGAMWIDCAQNPRRQLIKAFRGVETKSLRHTLSYMMRAFAASAAGTCTAAKSLGGKRSLGRREVDAIADNIVEGNVSSSPGDNTAANAKRSFVLPDTLIVNGTVYTDGHRGDLRYFDRAGNHLVLGHLLW